MIDDAEYQILSTIRSPTDLRRLKQADLPIVADELRRFLIEAVSRTGGHLGSNLGAVEFTIALHYVYDTPRDLIVWDVGAQAYPHKILTGRMSRFHTNRQYGGIAGFPRRDESEYDTFGVGHSSTSISAALGMAVARDLAGEKHKVIAVIGDGAMTGGMAYEGLNHAGAEGRDITVVLNDNRMSISPNVGALTGYLASIRADPRFEKLKDTMWQLTGKLPRGSKLRKALGGVEAGIRAMLVPGLWFERLGFRYVGPIDGHNLPELVRMFRWLKSVTGPVLIHLLTVKGKGFAQAESDRLALHAVSKFDSKIGPTAKPSGDATFAEIFSDELCRVAEEDPKVVAITPAMIEGSSLNNFQERFPKRCFDVGIAEQHAVTFAAGLAARGFKPVAAIYSTFLQRAFDQVIHDTALQDLPVVLGVDRAGLVGEDGPTHHGAFDLSYLRMIPKVRILIPRNGNQLRLMLREALKIPDGPTAIRFPRGRPPAYPPDIPDDGNVWRAQVLRAGTDGVVIGMGILLAEVLSAAENLFLSDGLKIAVVDLRCVKPLPEEDLIGLAKVYPQWLVVEENALKGGAGSALLEFIADRNLPVKLHRMGLPDRFIPHGDRESLLKDAGISREHITAEILRLFRGSPAVIKPRIKAGSVR